MPEERGTDDDTSTPSSRPAVGGPDDVTTEIPVAAETTTELPAAHANGAPRWSASPMFVFTITAAIGLLLGLAVAGLSGSAGVGGTIVADEVVGPEGATLTLSSGGSLVIPSGALASQAQITVTAGRIRGGRTAYIFSPEIAFERPVRVTLPTNDPSAVVVASRRGHLTQLSAQVTADGITFELVDFRFE